MAWYQNEIWISFVKKIERYKELVEKIVPETKKEVRDAIIEYLNQLIDINRARPEPIKTIAMRHNANYNSVRYYLKKIADTYEKEHSSGSEELDELPN